MIVTARLRGTPLALSDFDGLRLLESDPEVQKTIFGVVHSADATRERLARFVDDWARQGFGQWAFRLADGELVGTCGLFEGRIPGSDGLEVGYMVRPVFWGRGFATEMTVAVVRFAFEHYDVPDVGAMLQPGNAASIRVLEKSGLRRKPDFLYLGEHPAARFGVTREEWNERGA
ncbi:MAG TPA: GNAT family N-acetyltransferase [Candidatus Elarobacter sp.]|nr:GNAT family N-acetyltransferase [Candidatus Elarobacter sp.]